MAVGTARGQLANQRRSGARREHLGAALVREIRAAAASDPADLFVRSEDERRLRQVLARLSDIDQEILTLVGWEELSITESGPAAALVWAADPTTVPPKTAAALAESDLAT